MINLPSKPSKRPMETTVSLINIVFLMLIFFLVAGQLSPAQDPHVTLSATETADPLPPPDALFARQDGSLYVREQEVTAADYLAQVSAIHDGQDTIVRLAADEALNAIRLLDHIGALYGAGAAKVVVVTRKGAQ
ncbi:biopolymer transporter ExbD [Roseibium denhamense]|uniref:Biopolymer transport protein ExbD n=1 Tax=Roseibium denhamense TaxID=76305 RepID=A0ABY1P8X4_9HYPH|nr:biopolymer transporter ExbD [Roseibium denhamense]MTI07152.1 biopolymer transporter ExbD [Roseibium denhamense]SMP26833.1 biopolymer transport protein ExbD [Roseibium denhamense]